MVPAYFIELDEMPLTSNGKINRKGPLAPDFGPQDRAEYKAPRTKVEEILVSAWEAVLGAENVSILIISLTLAEILLNQSKCHQD